MPRRNNRAAAPSPNQLRAVSDELTRFVRDVVRDPEAAIASMKSIRNDAAPPPEHVTNTDLISQPGRNLNREFNQGPGVREVHGPAYQGPTDRRTYSRANSPAPAVSTSHPSAHPYAPAGGSGKVVFLPTGVNLPTGVDPCE